MTPHRPRLNLVVNLPGAASAGTYGAGVLDFLIEALDAFSEASHSGKAPAHDVVLTAISGTSAGAQTALIFAASIAYRFAPVTQPNAASDPAAIRAAKTRNPFFEHWVERNDLRDYLTTRDSPMRSLLDPTNVDDVADSVLRFGIDLEEVRRPWVADPLRLGVAVTNLRGMPTSYRRRVPWGDFEFTRHADSIFFAVGGLGSAASPPPVAGEHELRLPSSPEAKASAWSDLGDACVASGAFPLVFAARGLERPTSDYNPAEIHARPPSEVPYRFCALDGGVFNSNPLDIAARLVAAGDGQDRTVLLRIGSTPISPAEGPSNADVGLLKMVSWLFLAVLGEARDRPDAINEHESSGLHESFVLSPHRQGTKGDEALAGSGLGGFAGYFMREFREHDFLLGRCNARAALARDLCLIGTDPLFANWTEEDKKAYAVLPISPGSFKLPIVPLIGNLRLARDGSDACPVWPGDRPDVDSYASDMRRRIRYVLRNLHSPRKNWLLRGACCVLGWILVPLCACLITRWLLARARRDLEASARG